MNCNQINRHDRDSLILFDEASHTYTVHGQVYKSVTTLIGEYFEQFDADYWAVKKAPSLGMTPEEVKAMWERNGEEARNLGTMMHAKIERYYLGQPNESDDTYRLFEQFTQYYHLTPYRTEWTIFDEDSKIAGTLDFLNFRDGVFTIFDWKRSNKIDPNDRNPWANGLNGLEHLTDTAYSHYCLQQNLYRYMLEKNYGIKVSRMNLVVLHPELNTYRVVPVPPMERELNIILNKIKFN